MHKSNSDIRNYTIYLESLLDGCPQHHHRNVDFRAHRPADPDVLLGEEDDNDMMGVDDNDQGSDDGHNPTVMVICIPESSGALKHLPCHGLVILQYLTIHIGRGFHAAFSISSCR
jgi:hypothetical protein